MTGKQGKGSPKSVVSLRDEIKCQGMVGLSMHEFELQHQLDFSKAAYEVIAC